MSSDEPEFILVQKEQIIGFLDVLEDTRTKSKLTLHDHYVSAYVISEEMVELTCELVAVTTATVEYINKHFDTTQEDDTMKATPKQIHYIAQLFLRTVELCDLLRQSNIVYELQ